MTAEIACQRLLVRHTLTWLVAANLIGLILAAQLLFPAAGSLALPGFGRLLPLHLNFQLYGFCALPLIGLLVRFFGPVTGPLSALGVRVWSAALAFSGISWLAGQSSGKIFAEWQGLARWVWAGALAAMSLAVLDLFRRNYKKSPRFAWTRGALAAALLPVPWIFVAAVDPRLYPPIDPSSGGATSINTVASVLGVVLAVAYFPFLLGIEQRAKNGGTPKSSTLIVTVALALHWAIFAGLDHGDHHHGEPVQVLMLLSTVIWLPLLLWHLSSFAWSEAVKPWLAAMAGWGTFTLATGLFAGLPASAVRVKYTNFMVGHVHAAVAGLVGAWILVILHALDPRPHDVRAFRLWQSGTIAMVVALTVIGLAEGEVPGLLWSGATIVKVGYGLRWLAGLMMFAASWHWLRQAWTTPIGEQEAR